MPGRQENRCISQHTPVTPATSLKSLIALIFKARYPWFHFCSLSRPWAFGAGFEYQHLIKKYIYIGFRAPVLWRWGGYDLWERNEREGDWVLQRLKWFQCARNKNEKVAQKSWMCADRTETEGDGAGRGRTREREIGKWGAWRVCLIRSGNYSDHTPSFQFSPTPQWEMADTGVTFLLKRFSNSHSLHHQQFIRNMNLWAFK